MTERRAQAAADEEKTATETPPTKMRVRANVATMGLRAFEEGDVPDNDETAAMIENGLLEKM
jgi:hypothetical protein